MNRRPLTLKLNAYPVRGQLSICRDLSGHPHIRAVLEIPEEGVVREVFHRHLATPDDDASITLEWLEEENGTVSTYSTDGIILNRQFPHTRYAIFKSLKAVRSMALTL